MIVEGILRADKYGTMLNKLAGKFDRSHVYYFDVPFDETLIRHASKPNAHEFGEKEMREWWREKDYLDTSGEKVLHHNLSAEDIVREVLNDIGEA